MVNYRYNILRKVGEGGSGEVFLAEDLRRKSQRVAIKILHPIEKFGADADEAFHNEVSALVDLSHPNLVRIFDFGIIRHSEPPSLQGRRFFSMEFIQGTESLQWISCCSNQEERESLLELLLLQSLSVLSYVHREGVIHFDIKPQNLVLVGEYKAAVAPLLKLTDFGFARKKEESLDISVRGTLEYTAPELLKGEKDFDHRIDLYSLGATFYHLLEGRCPFEGKNPVELAKRVLTEEPTFGASAGGGRPRLREVIRILMQKAPAQRCSSAEHAARMLVANNKNGKEIFESYFGFSRKPAFVGRANERETIHSAISSLARNEIPIKHSAIAVSGAEGIGKTTLLHESVKFARLLDLTVYELEAVRSDVPFEGIADILDLIGSDICSSSDEGKEVFDKFDLLLGMSRETNLRFESWGRQKESVIELMARFISESSVILPFIIVVDNAQHLDDSSANVLRTVARDDHAQRFLLFVAETAERVEILPPTIARELHLHELAEDDISRMSASLFGEGGVSSEIGSRIYQLYGGTPGIVVEALNAVSAIIPDDALRDSSNARKYIAELESKLPKNIDDFLLGRFHKLNRERQLIISILSCVQYPIKASLLYQVLPFHTLRSADHTRFLQLDGFIGVAENDRSVYIRMKRLKDAVYETIKEERNELHALIATTLEQDQTAPDFTRLQEMAYQFSRCNNYEKACTFSDRAGDEGLKFFALQRALQLYRDAIGSSKLTDQPERDLCLQVKYASALHKAGSYREAIDLGKELTESKRPTAEQQFNLLKVIGLSASRLGETEQAQKYLTLSLKLSTNEIEQLELRQELVGLQISAGHFKEAEIECREQLAYAKHLNVDRLVGAIYTDLGIAAFFQDHFDDAVLCFTDAMKTYEALNEKTQVINSINNIGNALSAKGDFTQAITYWERALKSSQEFGTPHQQAQIQNNLGIAYYNLKKYDKAKQFYADARAGYERTNSKIGYAFALTNLGEVMFAEGEYEGALNQWRDAKQLYASMDNPHGFSESCLHIANVLSRLGDLTSMSAQLDDADKMIEKNSLDTFRGKYHYLRGMCFLKQGKVESAEEAFRRACDLYRADNAKESLWLSSIRLAECFVQQRKHTAAAFALFEVLNNSEAARLPHVIAEADYLIGTVALAEPSIIHEKAIVYFKHGIDAIAKEPVSETTWKLAFALAREYYERGQRERAREFLIKTRLILQFFLSHFKSLELKKQYLEVDQKERVFATIEAITKN